MFVPGMVLDSPEGAQFLRGEIVETPEGPRLLPPDLKGDGQLEMCVQGFDINIDEARLFLGKSKSGSDVNDHLGGVGGAVVSPEALKALASGFEAVQGNNVIPVMGEGKDVDKVMKDEMLQAYDSPKVRKAINKVFKSVLKDLCGNVDDVCSWIGDYINSRLGGYMDTTLMSAGLMLNPALEELKGIFEHKREGDSEAFDILNLISGIITCSIPGALKDCCSNAHDFDERGFKDTLLAYVEDSIRGILEEDGTMSNGLAHDIKELVELAKDIQFDDNKSFFSKVTAVTEGKCNGKFIDNLLDKLASNGSVDELNNEEVRDKLVNVLGSRGPLQEAFKEMMDSNPDFIKDVLINLAKEDQSSVQHTSAVDLLHNAIVRTVDEKCQKELDSLIHRLEEEGDKGTLTDYDIKSMLKQAVGLAKHMGNREVVETLTALMNDPVSINAIKDDKMTRDVLRKILVMRKLAEKDARKRKKLEQLERYNSSEDGEDNSLRDFINESEALMRTSNHGKLRKSKSMAKKGKSIIQTAKDIPMNAFMAIKSTADRKDEKWLQNFLSESVVEEIPWECSKALIILKEGFQVSEKG